MTLIPEVNTSNGKTTITNPNILVLMVDEMRYPPVYESSDLATWRSTYLPTQQALRDSGMEFRRHYTASMACAPSRTTFWTGQYPSLHGVTQTDGAAKDAIEEDMFWLDPDTVPTLGDYFRAAGYRTFWKGKWHMSDAAILVPGTHDPLASYDNMGQRSYTVEQFYVNAARLEDYGFSGWVGPDPHGSDPLNSGSSAGSACNNSGENLGRDGVYADQVTELIQQLDADSSKQSWLMVASFVNPHDIALWSYVTGGPGAAAGQFEFKVDNTVPTLPQLFNTTGDYTFVSTQNEVLSTKPSCQLSYRTSYGQIFMPAYPLPPKYFQYYYQLHKNVDYQLGRVYKALKENNFLDNTIVVFTSDHGDLLGSHGGMMQKWYQTYEEALHVPFIISNPKLFPPVSPPLTQDIPTSHADFVPTMLGLAGLDQNALRLSLTQTHTESWPLVGQDLSPLVLGQPESYVEGSDSGAIFFMSDDDPSRGNNQENFIGLSYDSVVQPNHIECVIVNSPDLNGDVALWKYTRYFDNTDFWTDPVTPTDVVTTPTTIPPSPPAADPGATPPTPPPFVPAPVSGTQTVQYTQTTKTTPEKEEFEMYNLTADPMELDNLASNTDYADIKSTLKGYLDNQRNSKRWTPDNVRVPFHLWPQITSFSPDTNTLPAGIFFISGAINGKNYNYLPTSVKFICTSGSTAGTVADATVSSDSLITYQVTLSAGTWQIYVQNAFGWAVSSTFTVVEG